MNASGTAGAASVAGAGKRAARPGSGATTGPYLAHSHSCGGLFAPASSFTGRDPALRNTSTAHGCHRLLPELGSPRQVPGAARSITYVALVALDRAPTSGRSPSRKLFIAESAYPVLEEALHNHGRGPDSEHRDLGPAPAYPVRRRDGVSIRRASCAAVP